MTTFTVSLPLLFTDEVLHLGTLDPSRRGEQHAVSYEGASLSVSHTPHAWEQIASLGGEPLQALSRPNGAFIDMLALYQQKDLVASLGTWGKVEGLAVEETRWRSWSFDEDHEEWRYSTHMSEEQARMELPEDEDGELLTEGPDGKPAVEEVTQLVPTPALIERVPGLNQRDNALDGLVMVWAEDHQPAVDGLWWQETYDPDGLSAPRGGILPSRVARWSPTPTTMSLHEDDEFGERLTSMALDVTLEWRTPLPMSFQEFIAACKEGDAEAVELALPLQNLRGMENRGSAMIPLLAAIMSDRLDVVNVLIPHSDMSYIVEEDGETYTPLMMAIVHSSHEIVMALAAASDPDHTNRAGGTALHFAASRGSPHTEALIPYSDIRRLTNDGSSVLMYAAQEGNLEIVKALMSGTDHMLTVGSDLHHANDAGQTALMLAAENGNKDAVLALLPGSLVEQADNYGKTAWMLAQAYDHDEVVTLLRDHERKLLEEGMGAIPARSTRPRL